MADIWCSEDNRKDNPALEGCTGQGRPSCTATECFYGIETCPICRGAKAIGGACGFVHCACPNGHGQMKIQSGPLAPSGPTAPSWKCPTCGIERMWPD